MRVDIDSQGNMKDGELVVLEIAKVQPLGQRVPVSVAWATIFEQSTD